MVELSVRLLLVLRLERGLLQGNVDRADRGDNFPVDERKFAVGLVGEFSLLAFKGGDFRVQVERECGVFEVEDGLCGAVLGEHDRLLELVFEGSFGLVDLLEIFCLKSSHFQVGSELDLALAHIRKPRSNADGSPLDPLKSKQQGYEDLIWTLLNSKEFLFNH